ncbi:hypothetical protein BK647_18020 [Pseudomonas protegens]|uniref:hypothetical protein n=1 Tax=Pseudomonas protegens TaxID=380021 RepID=UPI000F48D6E0|nr:hypothetical protein [Pseudomonas protegens]ROM40647.1 hypothetical protein BK647_18020 [Pseudomonas protegens]
MKNLNLTDIRGELQGAATIMHMIVEISSSGILLSDEGRAGLFEVGKLAIDRIEGAVVALGDYEPGKAPS